MTGERRRPVVPAPRRPQPRERPLPLIAPTQAGVRASAARELDSRRSHRRHPGLLSVEGKLYRAIVANLWIN